MNATQTSTAPEVQLTRAAKEDLLRKMYSLTHWIELVRLIGYQAIPMEKARLAIGPLAEQFGKEPMAQACEVLVEIFTPDKEPLARLKPLLARIDVRVCYCSVFDECYVHDSRRTEPGRIESCPVPAVPYTDE